LRSQVATNSRRGIARQTEAMAPGTHSSERPPSAFARSRCTSSNQLPMRDAPMQATRYRRAWPVSFPISFGASSFIVQSFRRSMILMEEVMESHTSAESNGEAIEAAVNEAATRARLLAQAQAALESAW